MKWPSDFPHMTVMTGRSGPVFLYHSDLKAKFAYKGDQWFSIGKRKEGDIDEPPVYAERDVELVTDPDTLAKLGSAVDYHKRVIERTRDMARLVYPADEHSDA
jgi:hypothetical protein